MNRCLQKPARGRIRTRGRWHHVAYPLTNSAKLQHMHALSVLEMVVYAVHLDTLGPFVKCTVTEMYISYVVFPDIFPLSITSNDVLISWFISIPCDLFIHGIHESFLNILLRFLVNVILFNSKLWCWPKCSIIVLLMAKMQKTYTWTEWSLGLPLPTGPLAQLVRASCW